MNFTSTRPNLNYRGRRTLATRCMQLIVQGQIHGGVARGIGQVLGERVERVWSALRRAG